MKKQAESFERKPHEDSYGRFIPGVVMGGLGTIIAIVNVFLMYGESNTQVTVFNLLTLLLQMLFVGFTLWMGFCGRNVLAHKKMLYVLFVLVVFYSIRMLIHALQITYFVAIMGGSNRTVISYGLISAFLCGAMLLSAVAIFCFIRENMHRCRVLSLISILTFLVFPFLGLCSILVNPANIQDALQGLLSMGLTSGTFLNTWAIYWYAGKYFIE